jgi:hypothetical protein
MKKKDLIGIILGLVLILMVLGCGALTELILDDAWALKEIKAGSIIATGLNDYLAVQFDAGTNEASFTIGPDWGDLSSQDPTGTYTFEVDTGNDQIVFKQSDEIKHSVTYEFNSDLGEMKWIEWIAVDPDPDIQIIGDDATIDYILFERAQQ